MALDRPYEDADEPGEARPELRLHHGRTGGDAHPAPPEPAESRSHAEYYEALRTADDRSDHADANHRETTDLHEGNSGWDAVDTEKRPPLDAVRVSPERATHILDGEPNGGGGHRHGIGRPEKTEFPLIWDDKHIMGSVLDVARRPDSPPVLQHWNDRWFCSGTRDRVEVSVILLRNGEVWTAWPEEGGPGVVRNPKKETP
jgi:hypothetical protein